MDEGIEVSNLNFVVNDECLTGGDAAGKGVTITVKQFTVQVSEGTLNGLIERFLPNESLQVTLDAGGARAKRDADGRRTSLVLAASEVRLDLKQGAVELRCDPKQDERAG